MKRKVFVLLVVLFVGAVAAGAASVEIPHLLNYQAKLTDKDNKPVSDGTYAVTVRIYDAETAGNMLWEETHPSVVIQRGVFSLLLGSVTPLGLSFDRPYFVELKVGDEVFSPRQTMASVGYAIRAEHAVPAGVIVIWSGSIANIPSGWALCDGANGTPDLRDRFVVGARQDDSGAAKTKLTGTLTQQGGTVNLSSSTGSHILTISEIPAHKHDIDLYGGESNDHTNVSMSYTNHYTSTGSGLAKSTGGGQGHTHPSEIPPYYALAYIMKL